MKRGTEKQYSRSFKRALAGYSFLLPNFLGFIVFTSIPVIASFLLAFTDFNMLKPDVIHFVGISNFIKLFSDSEFGYYCYNTIFLMLAIPISIFGSLGLALLLNRKLHGIVFYRTCYFLPTISSGVAIYVLWRWIYNTDIGLFNTAIRNFGDLIHINFQGIEWLTDSHWAKPALIIMGVWQTVGGHNMILYLAALQGVPRSLYEAADIDGANEWQKFWNITWPMISPTTFFILIMSIIGGFQSGFDSAYIMTGGGPYTRIIGGAGPYGSTKTIMFYVYDNAFGALSDMGYAAAISWVLFVIIFVFTLINWKTGGKRVHY